MIHGIDFGIQYEIKLTTPVDLYNVIMPICIEIRNVLKYNITNIDKVNKLIIIPSKNLDDRFQQKKYGKKYIHNRSLLRYNDNNINRITNPHIFKYYDVKVFNDYIKNNHNLPEKISKEVLDVLEKRFNQLMDMYNDVDYIKKYSQEERFILSNERNELNKIIKIQRVLLDVDYYNEIIKIYENLTDIELNLEEQNLINSVLTHPKLNCFIDNHGFSLVDCYY
jgi:hypothetical protein